MADQTKSNLTPEQMVVRSAKGQQQSIARTMGSRGTAANCGVGRNREGELAAQPVR